MSESPALTFKEVPINDSPLAGQAMLLLAQTLLATKDNVISTVEAAIDQVTGNMNIGTPDPNRAWLFVCSQVVSGDEIVTGALTIVKDRPTMGLNKDTVHLFAVPEELRSRGIGSQLLSFAEEAAKKRGVKKIQLRPTSKAIPLYLRSGYKPHGNPKSRFFYMTKRLSYNPLPRLRR